MAQESTKGSERAVRVAERKSREPKFIVLDANVFIADYWLRSPSFVLLRDFLKKTSATLVVPKVVFEEVVNHQKEDLDRVKSDVRRALRDAGRLIRNFKTQEDSVKAISKKSSEDPYEKFLSSELAGLKSRVPDYNEIPHADVVRRDLRRQKPFQESGKGYRDTLLWETILRNCIEKDVVTVLITNNVRDFYDSAGDLHKHLQSDVLARKADKNSLVLCRDLPTFTDTYVVPYLRKRKDFAALVQHDKVSGLNLTTVCEENVDTLIEALNKSPSVMIDDPGQYEPEVDVIDIQRDFHVDEASELSKNLLLVVFEFHAEVYFTYFLPRSEYYPMSDDESSKIIVLDADWNDYVMRVETKRTARFTCRLTFNSDGQEVESFEVEAVESVDESSSQDFL
jgi:hypothetical protein